VCKNCLLNKFDHCTLLWEKKTLNTKGTRNPNAVHIQQQLNTENTEADVGSWEVLSLQGKRYVAGKAEYLVEWKGYDEMTWVKEKDISAPEMIEDWELEHENM
jgi:hypothetical protein